MTLAKKCEQASRDLDIIQQYLGDYEEILQQCPKESRNFNGGAAAAAAAGART